MIDINTVHSLSATNDRVHFHVFLFMSGAPGSASYTASKHALHVSSSVQPSILRAENHIIMDCIT